ncbi:L-rhamnose/proton symporter RhaT [Vibrio mediterranei]
MITTALTGICLHAVGAASSASSIVPGKFVKNWQWDVYWVGFALVSLLFLPFIVAGLTIPEVRMILAEAETSTIAWTLGLGFMYGFGGYGFGYACRVIGFSMTYAISIGFSATVGTIIPPLVMGGEQLDKLLHTSQGAYVFSALAIAIVGMVLVGKAGYGREKFEQQNAENSDALSNNKTLVGILVALGSGFLSACYGFALHAGDSLAVRAVELGANPLLKINVVFILANGGALISNLIICYFLIKKQNNFHQFKDFTNKSIGRNYALALLGGAAWYFQFFFYGIAEHFMEDFSVASWAIHMIMLIIFAQLWGIYFKEWKSSPSSVKRNLYWGLGVLTLSVLTVAYGNFVNL